MAPVIFIADYIDVSDVLISGNMASGPSIQSMANPILHTRRIHVEHYITRQTGGELFAISTVQNHVIKFKDRKSVV